MTHLLADGLLSGRRFASFPQGTHADRLARLGALTDTGPVQGLLYDARPSFGGGGAENLRQATDECWATVRSVVAEQMIPAGTAGPVVLIGPPPAAGPLAGALRATLENLVRTLSVEWARHRINTVALLPVSDLHAEQEADLVAFLLSPASAYLSGTTLQPG